MKEVFKTIDDQELVVTFDQPTIEVMTVDIPIQSRNDPDSVTTRRRQQSTTETLNNALILNMILSYAFNSILS